jgi:erythromycin esterase
MNKLRLHLKTAEEESDDAVVQHLGAIALPFDRPEDIEPLLDRIGDARVVLLGEASHGTSEYYLARARLSQRLIAERGFSFVAVEGDWPDCYQVNRYVRGYADAGATAPEVLHSFGRWPTWMWGNWETVAFMEWLRRHNAALPSNERAGFYGLDVYSLWDSLAAVQRYLERVDPDAAIAARRAFRCFEPFEEDLVEYARATALVPVSCEAEVVELLSDLRRSASIYAREDPEGYFDAEQNALVVSDAESYYRAMLHGGAASWNVRDQHMADTLDRLLRKHGPGAKAIVWAHNTHVGDARFTDMARAGMFNLGQLARLRYADIGVVVVGYGSSRGSVIAAREWDAPLQRMPIPPAIEGSWEALFHRAGAENRLVLPAPSDGLLAQSRGQRAIGVVYHPEAEYRGNYVPTVLAQRYDAFVYLDETRALHPLRLPVRRRTEPPETYPWGV